MATKKTPPSREQLAALANKLKDAPTIANDEQMSLWASIGRADGWASMTPSEREDYRVKHNELA